MASTTPFVTDLPSASSCPSPSNRNLFRGFGEGPRSRALLHELLLTIWLIFWNRPDSCRWKQNRNIRVGEETITAIVALQLRFSFNTYPKRFTDRYQHSVKAKKWKWEKSMCKETFVKINLQCHAISQMWLNCRECKELTWCEESWYPGTCVGFWGGRCTRCCCQARAEVS